MSRARQEKRTLLARRKRIASKITSLSHAIKSEVSSMGGIDRWADQLAENFLESCDTEGLQPTRANLLAVIRSHNQEVSVARLLGGEQWKGCTEVNAIETFITFVIQKANVRAGTGGHGRMVRRSKGLTDLDVAKARVTIDRAERGDISVDAILDTLGQYAAEMVNADMENKNTQAVDHASHLIDMVVTPAFRERLLIEKWHGVAREDLDEELLREVANRADLRLACLFVHAAADQSAANGENEDPRKIGMEATYDLVNSPTMHVVRDVLVAVRWRDVETGDDVDMKFGRLVEERARALQRGDLDFAMEALLRVLPTKEKRAEAESAFMRRYEADYFASKRGLPQTGSLTDGTRDEKADAVEALVKQIVSNNVAEVREQFKDGWPEDLDASLDIPIRFDRGGMDAWPHMRAQLVELGWRGATLETIDRLMVKELILQAAKMDMTIKGAAELIRQSGHEELADRLANAPMVQQDGIPKIDLRKKPTWVTPKGFDEYLMTTGVNIWGDTYRSGMSDDAVRSHVDKTRVRQPEQSIWGREESVSMATFAAKWAVHAFQRVQSSHTFAAAMMATSTHPECKDDLEVAWDAFMVHVPSGLLYLPPCEKYPSGVDYNRILVASFSYGAEMHLIGVASGGDGAWSLYRDQNLAAVLLDETEPKTPLERIALLARRFVTGLLFAMQQKGNVKERTVKASRCFRDGKRHEEPEHRIVIVGEPITVDCRDAIKSYIEKGSCVRHVAGDDEKDSKQRKPPQVQWLVRGHRRLQACGVGWTQRRVIRVEAYWKGREGAPILMRPKRVVGKPA